MLIDRTTIFVRSGKGGDGCVSLRREKFVPKGGPDGGDGGDGGDVILRGDRSVGTLLPLTPRPHYRAKNGQPGMGRSMHGADGPDLVVDVPLGTLVYDQESEELIADIVAHDQRVVVAAGGRGGFGNEHFKSATNQTPREAIPGEPRVERTLRLELKLIADVGLIGKPNAGKSTLLRAMTNARPKVADYPFTTIAPHLGIAELGTRKADDRRLVVADIPGLIEGAAGGAGLGHDFLRHVERTKVLVHVVDVAPIDGTEPLANYEAIRAELYEHSPELAEKPEIVVFNKVDLLPPDEREQMLGPLAGRLGLPREPAPLHASGATGEGTDAILERCWQAIHGTERVEGWGRGGGR